MAFTKVTAAGITTSGGYTVQDLNAVGVVTASSFVGALTGNVTGTATTATSLSNTPNIVVGVVTAVSAEFSGNISVAGTITYEDVTSVDSVGIITARSGIRVTGGSVGIGTDNPQHKLNVYNQTASSTGGILVQNVTYSSSENRPYLIVGTKDWTGATTTWNTFGFQHRIKSNSGGTPRITIDTLNGEAFCVDNNKRVGIGTDNPISELMVENATQSHITVKTSGSNMAKFGSKGNDVYIGGTAGAANIIFKRNIVSTDHPADSGTETVRITSTGNVGINTTTFPANGTNLKVSNGTISRLLLDKTGTDARSFSIGNGGTYINLYDETADVERLRITSDGQLRSQATYNGSSSTSNTFPALNLNNLQSSYTANNIIGGVTFGKAPGHGNGIRAGMLALYAGTGSLSDNIGTNLVFRTAAESGGDSQERLRITSSGNVGIGTAEPRDKLEIRGGSFCKTGIQSNFRPHILVRTSSPSTIKYFEYYFDTQKILNSPNAVDQYILDITNIDSFLQASFEVVYGTRLQGISDATTSTCHKTFGVNRFNNASVAITDINSINVDSNSNTYADLRMDALSSSAVRMKIAFSSSLGGSSFCSGVVRGWGVFDVFRDPGTGGVNQLEFYNGV